MRRKMGRLGVAAGAGLAAFGAAGSLVAVGSIWSAAHAQTALPGIVIESASPVRPSGAPQPGVTTEPAPPGTTVIASDSFVPITVVTGNEILSSGGSTLTDAIDQRPGIWGSTFAPGASRPILRGLDNHRVRVQFDGIDTQDVSALSEDHGIPVDPHAARTVEVVRGPATLRYGSQAIGGVVSARSNRIARFSPPNGWMGEVRGGINSADRGKDGGFNVTAGAGGVVAHADGFRRESDDYRSGRGRVENSFVKSHGFGLGLSRVWNAGFVGVSFSRVESLYGIPGEDVDHAPAIDLKQDRVQVQGEWRLRQSGVQALRLWLGWSDYAHDEVITENGVKAVGTRFEKQAFEGRLEIQHMPIMTGLGMLDGVVGVQVGRGKVRGFGVDEPVDGLLDTARTETVAAFWFQELKVTRRLKFQVASRIEQAKVEGTGIIFNAGDPASSATAARDKNYVPISGSAGVLYELPAGVVVSLTGQYVERAPSAAELFSKGVHEATGTFEIGSPDLAKERATAAELAFRRAKGQLRFDASAFYARYDGFIYKQLTGTECGDTLATCGSEDELSLVRYQQRDATFYGAELSAQYDVAPIWRGVWGIDGRYDFVRAQFSGGENAPRIPPHRVGAGLFYRDKALFARFGVLHAFKQDKIGANEIETPGFTLVSAELAYTTRLATVGLGPAPTFTIGIKGTNLTDDVVLNHASFKRREEVALPGASVRIYGRIRWQ
ncbi:MAG: TonB-dependent receptor [Hyphomicrobiaceae bacterium]|nr:TonB-dependent receptor [Hyphomicrobiaceae bacterium]